MRVVAGASAFAADPAGSAGEPAPSAGGRGASDGRAVPLAIAIGNFDGVHRGHQALLAEARARAQARGGASAVLTFAPHPARLFAPDRAPPLIMSLERRLELVADAGIDLAIVEPFTPAFASIEADAFVAEVLCRDLGARDVVVGYDFSFGRGRRGDVRRLIELGARAELAVAVIPQIAIDGRPCSSTKIRELVAAGLLADAAVLLGRRFEIEGRVVRGAGRGRQLGFPTANLAPDAELLPRTGIYAARALILDGPGAGARHLVALSVGTNPTFAAGGTAAPVTVEAHLLDFEADLYEHRLRVEVGERLRDERRFDSVKALVAQIEADVARVRELES